MQIFCYNSGGQKSNSLTGLNQGARRGVPSLASGSDPLLSSFCLSQLLKTVRTPWPLEPILHPQANIVSLPAVLPPSSTFQDSCKEHFGGWGRRMVRWRLGHRKQTQGFLWLHWTHSKTKIISFLKISSSATLLLSTTLIPFAMWGDLQVPEMSLRLSLRTSIQPSTLIW